MRAFVLSTGRCGSKTFALAAGHIPGYTAGHESRATMPGPGRLEYPDWHVESDNRLAWFLGTLDVLYAFDSQRVVWVHLTRDRDKVAASYARRFGPAAIMPAFSSGIVRQHRPPQNGPDRLAAARFYVDTVTDNIRHFMRRQRLTVDVDIDDPHEPFDRLWDMLDADDDPAAHAAAHTTLGRVHNVSRGS